MTNSLVDYFPGYDRFLETIQVPDAHALRDAVIAGHPFAHRDGASSMFRSVFEGVSWSWPLREQWAERFNALGAIPYLWRHLDTYQMLSNSLCQYGQEYARRMRYRKLLGSKDYPHKIRFFSLPGDEAKAIQELDVELVDRFRAGDRSADPPFYPGSRSSYSIVSTVIIERRGWTDCFDAPDWY